MKVSVKVFLANGILGLLLFGIQPSLAAKKIPLFQVSATENFQWDQSAVNERKGISGGSQCGGPVGYEDFDSTWGPITAPEDLIIYTAWKPNGCTSETGKLTFYVVTGDGMGEGQQVHQVTGDIGYDKNTFQYSAAINLNGIVTAGEIFYIRVAEEDDGSSGGADYHIYSLGVFGNNVVLSNYIDVVMTNDINGNGTNDIAALKQEKQPIVVIKDGQTGKTIKTIKYFDATYDSLGISTSVNTNQEPTLTVLGKMGSRGIVKAQIRNAKTGILEREIPFMH